MMNDFSVLSSEVTYFLLVYEQKSINSAARKINQNPGNISRHLSRFEESVGKKLFSRHKTGLNPTAYGEKLFRVLTSVRNEFTLNMATSDSASTKIKIGFSPTVGYSHFSKYFLKSLVESGMVADFTVLNSMTLIESIKKRELDFVLIPSAVKFPGLISKTITSENLVLCSKAKEPTNILITSSEMLGLDRIVQTINYSQRWNLNDYFVVRKFLETNSSLMGIIPENLCSESPHLHILKHFQNEGKITALTWPSSEGVNLIKSIKLS
jgi:DNA-binding transcriptional LysR family regulator